LFLKKDGTLWGTGRNSNAILGDRDPESSTQRVTVPRQIANGVLLPSE
jgi:alpha-tubulin suppressor-like RCC1 family protein